MGTRIIKIQTARHTAAWRRVWRRPLARLGTVLGASALDMSLCMLAGSPAQAAQLTAAEQSAVVGDAPANPGPLATALSAEMRPEAVRVAMRKVADWQLRRVQGAYSQAWTFTTLYAGLIVASGSLHDPQYHRDFVRGVAEHHHWSLGPRSAHADDQAIGQIYLELNQTNPDPAHVAYLRHQFDGLMRQPDDPRQPIWWWCDALFMAPPVWAQLAETTHRDVYLA